MYEHIVVGTDLSETAGIATEAATALASKLGAKLTLVYAGSDPGEPLQDLADKYNATAVSTPGNPADVLIEETENLGGDLLVVGSVGMAGARRFLIGSVPNKVSHHATTDLLVVKTDPPPKKVGAYSKVLVGTDGSPTAMHAVDMAAQLCAALQTTPTIVCAYEPPTKQELDRMRVDYRDPIDQWSVERIHKETPPEFHWRIAASAQAEDVLDRSIDHAARQGVEADVRAEKGAPAEVLISIAETEGFDVIVVGNVGMSGPKRFSLGNVPHRISHHAPTDVLILRTT